MLARTILAFLLLPRSIALRGLNQVSPQVDQTFVEPSVEQPYLVLDVPNAITSASKNERTTERVSENIQKCTEDEQPGVDVRRPPTISFVFNVTSKGKPTREDYDKLVQVTSSTVNRILREIYLVRDEVDYAYTLVGNFFAVEPGVVEFDFYSYFGPSKAVPPSSQLNGFLLLQLAEGSVHWTTYLQQIRSMGSEYFSSTVGVSLKEVESTERKLFQFGGRNDFTAGCDAGNTLATRAAIACVVICGITVLCYSKNEKEELHGVHQRKASYNHFRQPGGSTIDVSLLTPSKQLRMNRRYDHYASA